MPTHIRRTANPRRSDAGDTSPTRCRAGEEAGDGHRGEKADDIPGYRHVSKIAEDTGHAVHRDDEERRADRELDGHATEEHECGHDEEAATDAHEPREQADADRDGDEAPCPLEAARIGETARREFRGIGAPGARHRDRGRAHDDREEQQLRGAADEFCQPGAAV